MASLSILRFYCCCLLCLSFSLLVHGVEVESWHVVRVGSLLPASICSSTKGSDPTKLNVVHRHGPCSPFKRGREPSHQQILNRDQSRVDWLHRKISAARASKVSGSLAASIPDRNGVSLGTGNYIVTVGFGNPKKDLTVAFDTGSDLTWIQCKPCVSCYPQQEPLYDPSQSSTYRNLSCSSNACSILDSPECSSSGTCRYTVNYVDKSKTTGLFVQDTLTLTPTDVIPNFLFGCGDQNSALFGQVAGLMGLGREPVSLVMQTTHKYGGVFSYCLPPTSSSTGYLKLGGGATANVNFTPMLTVSNMPSFYFINLIAISVGGQQLPVSSTVFSTPGTVLDSGTVITRLPPAAYSALRSAFKQRMQSYPTAPAYSLFDTCYNFTGHDTITIPTVALQFGNRVTTNLDISGILTGPSVSQVCLAFADNSDAGDGVIIGNVQQRTFNVVYDLPNQRIGFAAGAC